MVNLEFSSGFKFHTHEHLNHVIILSKLYWLQGESYSSQMFSCANQKRENISSQSL